MSGRLIRRIPKVCTERMQEVFLVEIYLRNRNLNGDIVEQLFSRECSEAERCRKEKCDKRCRWVGMGKKCKDPLADPTELYS